MAKNLDPSLKPEGWNPRSHGGQKHDAGKPRVDLLDAGFVLRLGEIMEYGARKYAEENWRKFDNPKPFLAAGMRHLLAALRDGALALDDESNLPHLAHAAVCMMMAFCVEEEK